MILRSSRDVLSHRPVIHRALRSFPTRRSSDLPRIILRLPRDPHAMIVAARWCPGQAPPLSAARIPHVHAEVSRANWARSEEHTSELQSHVNLVCRLLLEKKNEVSVLNYQPAQT